MRKSTISMAMFNSYVKLPEGTSNITTGWNSRTPCCFCRGTSSCSTGSCLFQLEL
jgi:hypothetical protein